MQLARRQFGINPLPRQNTLPLRLSAALNLLHRRWPDGAYVVGDSLSVADIAVAALLPSLSFDSSIPS
jgi:glutathione S-transferase